MLTIRRRSILVVLAVAALLLGAVLTSCGIKTYNMTDPGKPSDTFIRFFEAVLENDDDTANRLLYNYSWKSAAPKHDAAGNSSVNGMVVSGSDAVVMDCLLKSRSCHVVSESDYTRDDLNAFVTVEYTSFDISEFQKALAEKSIGEVKAKQYLGEVFKDENDTKEIIESIKLQLLEDPQPFIKSRKYRIELVSAKGQWKVVLTEEFYKALLGYPN